MIGSFRNQRLRRLVKSGDSRNLPTDQIDRIRRILSTLDQATGLGDLKGLPSLHSLKGDMEGYWAVRVSRNWRITFRFLKDCAWEVDLIDYH